MRHVRAVLASALLGSVVSAQNVGDLYVLDTQQQAILYALRGGPVATLYTPSPNDATAMTNGPGDGSVYVWTNTPTAIPRPSLLRVDASTISVVSSVASPFTLVRTSRSTTGGIC